MELRVLRYFLAVAREESISGAAQFLHITQPTLSRQLMELEEELGVKLLSRGRKNRKVQLTEEGMLLRRRAEEILELADKTQAELSTSSDAISGDIFIGGGETDAMRLIAKTAKALQWAGIAYELRTTLYPGMTLKTLCDLLAAFPPAPRWRVNYFRPPAVFRPQDVPLLQRPALTQPELMAARDALLAIQPNLIL